MNILALDLGTTTGWAALDTEADPQLQRIGSVRLASAEEIKQWGLRRIDRRQDPRPLRLYDHLAARLKPDIIIFEDVEFQTYTKQTQLWSSLRTAVWFYARNVNALCECVPVSVLKKFATGHGGATKAMMVSALVRRFPNRFSRAKVNQMTVLENQPGSHAIVQDDNAVDAAWLALWAQQHLGRIKL